MTNSILANTLKSVLPANSVEDSYSRRYAWSTDASYFRIVPEVVVTANSPEDILKLLRVANRFEKGVTFRAAGTSLSGQAIGEGILARLGYDGFRKIEMNDDASMVSLGPAVIGNEANIALAPFGKKIGPDPATLKACMIGGIVSNNASGMCCGTHQNSYQTIASLKLIFADGSRLDTGNERSKLHFAQRHPQLLTQLVTLAKNVKSDPELTARIAKKFSIKNTTGYSINALIDFTDPFDILNHLIIGSEGTLAFVEEATYNTVEDAPYKATALAVFDSMELACSAVPFLKKTPVAAVELLDWPSIVGVMGKDGMPDWLDTLPEGSTVLLIETRGNALVEIKQQTKEILASIDQIPVLRPTEFSDDPDVYTPYWAMRSGIFPIVGAERPLGSSVIIEDIAFQVEHLAAAAKDLAELFEKYGYHGGCMYGHALAGNFHFIITPSFNTKADQENFDQFMQEVATIVIDKYDGSMKAEHGTGRAVAPFVEQEWGEKAYQIMQKIKNIFDPKGILNPGVILNNDPKLHVKNMKLTGIVDELVDKCIECGFCESNCPTRAFTMTPRQRITTLREINRLKQEGLHSEAEALASESHYDVVDTCVGCQLCFTHCPVDNNTGQLVRTLKQVELENKPVQQKSLDLQAKHYNLVNTATNVGFKAIRGVHSVLGDNATDQLMKLARSVSSGVPAWTADFPTGSVVPKSSVTGENKPVVVYFPSCGTRTFGATKKDKDNRALPEVMVNLMERAGYEVRVIDNARKLCCGQIWESKGDFTNADLKRDELMDQFERQTESGRYPVVIDAASCTHSALKKHRENLVVLDAVEFLHDHLLDKLMITPRNTAISMHIGCSAQHLNLESKLMEIANRCTDSIFRPKGISCCGFAGEKGFYQPEINANALRTLKAQLPKEVKEGYYANRMCELGLTHHSGISYRHIAYLLDECSQ
ncbi:FAD-binding oxidoreductase [Vibrio sp. SS-MA-C1-2]|uniref:FAD-binding and (Fe-S)-binding domain-containing protein n=1 Tax=Vibrio sp. SS-MA-C1-2 TaxID=2908646 RepID=UPI001F461EF4|nr:FAD-binding and (Fe-S)-binding domain-containing protein [Vibrio sp. SS-MA-C1-2]UJF17970.1 FAD-binding oxidoreductase [Vibrio sp. SS-MA-C1-2]